MTSAAPAVRPALPLLAAGKLQTLIQEREGSHLAFADAAAMLADVAELLRGDSPLRSAAEQLLPLAAAECSQAPQPTPF